MTVGHTTIVIACFLATLSWHLGRLGATEPVNADALCKQFGLERPTRADKETPWQKRLLVERLFDEALKSNMAFGGVICNGESLAVYGTIDKGRMEQAERQKLLDAVHDVAKECLSGSLRIEDKIEAHSRVEEQVPVPLGQLKPEFLRSGVMDTEAIWNAVVAAAQSRGKLNLDQGTLETKKMNGGFRRSIRTDVFDIELDKGYVTRQQVEIGMDVKTAPNGMPFNLTLETYLIIERRIRSDTDWVTIQRRDAYGVNLRGIMGRGGTNEIHTALLEAIKR